MMKKATLILEDGSKFEGKAFGAIKSTAGEVVFQTGMVGYPESLTDPSYTGQLLCLTFPLVGNYGVPDESLLDEHGIPKFFESDKIHPAALIVSYLTESFSHWNAVTSLSDYLAKHGVPGITDIDTRALTKKLRVDGSMKGKIVIEGDDADKIEFYDPNLRNLVADVSINQPKVFNPDGKVHIVAVDVGLKNNQLRCLISRGAKVTLVPWNYNFAQDKTPFDGLFLSNGPGDPEMADATITHLRDLMKNKPDTPIFGICLGHQLLSLAAGATTYKLPFGNRGHNQPCIHEETQKCYITSQNHGFATDAAALPAGWKPLFTNANDNSNEGIIHSKQQWFSVQFHPEANAGPRDLESLFDVFLETCKDTSGMHVSQRIIQSLKAIEHECYDKDYVQPKPKKVIILGSGGLSIGQAGEFDYSGSQAIKALKEEGIFTVLINPNIATVQTMAGLADKVYFLPVTPNFVRETIIAEKPDSILLSFGGQTALNCGLQLDKSGVLAAYGVKVLGTPTQAIEESEDREMFAAKVAEIGFSCCPSIACFTVDEVKAAAKKIGFPLMMRASFALGGLGSGVVKNDEQLKKQTAFAFANSKQITLEPSLLGWKEVEYEVVRDAFDNTITVCNMENFDPLGVHTGESIVIAPSQTLSDDEYQMLRDCACKVVRHLGIVGECNIQYALNPNSREFFIIEVNARLSRSSALASKATGYPLAYVAAKLSLGISLPTLRNAVTQKTTACFEPSLDYCVVKVPRWDLNKFPGVDRVIGTQMKSVGEVMAIGRTFEEAFQKSLRMLDIGADGFDAGKYAASDKDIETPSDHRFLTLASALADGYTVDKIHQLTKIDKWFLTRLERIANCSKSLAEHKNEDPPIDLLKHAKQLGFSDKQIGKLVDSTELRVRRLRKKHNLRPSVKQIDTVAAEYPAATNYLYLTYNGVEDDVGFGETFTMVLGSGVYRIGSSVEFDYCAVGCVRELRRLGHSTIMLNCNPETVSTDYDECDRLYFDQLTFETVMDIYELETVKGIILSMGGQIPNNIAMDLGRQNVRVFGTHPNMIDGAENRFKFSRMCDNAGIDQPEWKELTSVEEAHKFCEQVTYPCLMRPSYILSGVGMRVVYSKQDLERDFKDAVVVSRDFPVVISKFILDAKEVEVDAVAHNGKILAHAVSEHVENAGVHSGDATIIHPAQDLTNKTTKGVLAIAKEVAKNLQINGPFNIQFIAKDDHLKVIECNVRVSRSFPFVSKTMGVDMIAIATRAMVGAGVTKAPPVEYKHVGVKVPLFSFARLPNADPTIGVDMVSTGEVACFGESHEDAYLKALQATNFVLPDTKKPVLLSIGTYKGKQEFLESARLLSELGYQLAGSLGTADFFSSQGIPVESLEWLQDSNEDFSIQEKLVSGGFGLVINLPMRNKYRRPAAHTAGSTTRKGAISNKVPLITDIKCAKLLVQAIAQNGIEPTVTKIDVQTSYKALTLPGLVAIGLEAEHTAPLAGSLGSFSALQDIAKSSVAGGFTCVDVKLNSSTLSDFVEHGREIMLCDYSISVIVALNAAGKKAARGLTQSPVVRRKVASNPSSPIRTAPMVVPTTVRPGRLAAASVSHESTTSNTSDHSVTEVQPISLHLQAGVTQLPIEKIKNELANLGFNSSQDTPLCAEATGHNLSSIILFGFVEDRHVHILNVQSGAELELIAAAKAKGIDVSCSVNITALMSPQIDEGAEGLTEEKDSGITHLNNLWNGIDDIDVITCRGIDLSDAVPILYRLSQDRDYDFMKLIEKISKNPSQIFGIPQDRETSCEIQIRSDGTCRVGQTTIRGKVVFVDGTAEERIEDSVLPIQPVRSLKKKVKISEREESKGRVQQTPEIVSDDDLFENSPETIRKRHRKHSLSVAEATKELTNKHVVSVRMFHKDLLHEILNAAHVLKFAEPAEYNRILEGVVLATIFYEPSTRTHCSFQSAIQRLGGSVIALDKIENTSVKKGESFSDFVKTMTCYADAIVVRHPEVGKVDEAAAASSKPVINGGDGTGEHPTQALLDVFTIREELGTLNNNSVTIVGDLKHSRTVHSLVKLLTHYVVNINCVAPKGLELPQDIQDELTGKGIQVQTFTSVMDAIEDTDVLYVTRIQKERFTDPQAYEKVKGSYVIDERVMAKAKKKMILMHPLPRVDEISPEVDSDPRAAYFRQMEYGVSLRMALLCMLLGKNVHDYIKAV
eukprot:m.145536 g.145536  ORF g.145536 m.145536 type:complete len:2190 (+) comp14948_c0_seq1:133-6702(+)